MEQQGTPLQQKKNLGKITIDWPAGAVYVIGEISIFLNVCLGTKLLDRHESKWEPEYFSRWSTPQAT